MASTSLQFTTSSHPRFQRCLPRWLSWLLPFNRGPTDSKEQAFRAWSSGYWAKYPSRDPVLLLGCQTWSTWSRALAISSPVVRTTGSDYRALVGQFENNTLSRFPSVAEARTYGAGANIPYPTTIYQWRP